MPRLMLIRLTCPEHVPLSVTVDAQGATIVTATRSTALSIKVYFAELGWLSLKCGAPRFPPQVRSTCGKGAAS